MDSATPSAPDWGDADEGDPLTDFGLDAAVRRLQAELADDKTTGPSAVDVLGDMASATAVRAPVGTTGRVVGAPPVAPLRPKSDALDDTARAKHGAKLQSRGDAPTAADLGQPALGRQARATPLDTGPIHGDPFGGDAALAPANPGQSHIGMGVRRRPVPGDFYGWDTPPPPGSLSIPAPAYGDSGPTQAVPPPMPAPMPAPTPVPGAEAFVPYSAEASHSSTAAGAMSADSMPTLGAHPSASWAVVPAADDEQASGADVLPTRDGNTERTAVEVRPVPDEPPSRRWIAYAMAGVMLGSVAVAVVLGPALLGDDGVEHDEAAAAASPGVASEPSAAGGRAPVDTPPNLEAKADTAAGATGRRTPPSPGTASTHGPVILDLSPKGSRVFVLAEGPDHRFTGLPEATPVLVLVTATGHVPRTRIVEAEALGTPVSIDLEPAGDEAVAFPFDLDVARPGDGPRTASLLVSSNTPGAELGVMVGEAPRVQVPALRAADTHRFLVVHPDHGDETIEVGPDAWAAVDGVYGARVEVELD